MGKVHSIIATIVLIFTILLVVGVGSYLIMFPEKSVGDLHEGNKDFLAMLSLLVLMGSAILFRIIIVFQEENNKQVKLNNAKSSKIMVLQEAIIGQHQTFNTQQSKYIDQMRKLNDAISENARRDNETGRAIDKLIGTIRDFTGRIANLEKKMIEHDREIKRLKK